MPDTTLGFDGETTAVLVAGHGFGAIDRETLDRWVQRASAMPADRGRRLVVVPEGDAEHLEVLDVVVGWLIAAVEADQEEQGIPGWDLGLDEPVEGTDLQDALEQAQQSDWRGISEGRALGEPQVFLVATGPLASAWIRDPDEGEIQVSFDGMTRRAIEARPGTYTLCAQYD